MIEWGPWRYDTDMEVGMYIQIVGEATDGERHTNEGTVVSVEDGFVVVFPPPPAKDWLLIKWRKGLLPAPPTTKKINRVKEKT